MKNGVWPRFSSHRISLRDSISPDVFARVPSSRSHRYRSKREANDEAKEQPSPADLPSRDGLFRIGCAGRNVALRCGAGRGTGQSCGVRCRPALRVRRIGKVIAEVGIVSRLVLWIRLILLITGLLFRARLSSKPVGKACKHKNSREEDNE
jgi:hypothetical protein